MKGASHSSSSRTHLGRGVGHPINVLLGGAGLRGGCGCGGGGVVQGRWGRLFGFGGGIVELGRRGDGEGVFWHLSGEGVSPPVCLSGYLSVYKWVRLYVDRAIVCTRIFCLFVCLFAVAVALFGVVVVVASLM